MKWNTFDKIFSLALNTIDSISEQLTVVVGPFYILLDAERLWNGYIRSCPAFGPQVQQSFSRTPKLLGQMALLWGFHDCKFFGL